MDEDGRNLVNLTSGPGNKRSPSCSLQGDLAYAVRSGNIADGSFANSIIVADYGGQNPINVSGLGAIDFQPRWSPDGERIALVAAPFDINVIDRNGENRTNLTNNPEQAAVSPAWQNNGTIFYSFHDGTDTEICRIDIQNPENADCLTDNETTDNSPDISQ